MNKRIGVLMYQTSNSKGQELVAQRMVRDFISLGHKAYLITSVYHDGVEVIPPESLRKSKGYVSVKDAELEIPIIRVDSYVVRWPRRRISFRDFVQALERIVDEFRLNVLVTHSTLWNGPEDVAKFVAWRRCMRDLGGYKDPLIFCHMSHYQEPSQKRYSLTERAFRIAWNKFSLSQILKTANLVLVVTPFERDANVKMGADPKKCFLFQSGVDEEPFLRFATSDVKDFLKRHRIPEGVKLVSYLGTLEERKNTLGILKIAEQLKERSDIHFIIAGRGNSEYANKVEGQASRLRNVTYLGEIDEKDKTLLIKSTYVNILMSHLEALGLTQLEFMYAGVPIVTSGAGGQAWLVRNGREGLHTHGPDDVEGAANAIASLVDDQETWTKLSTNAREKARTFTSSKMIRELDEAIIKETMKENGLEQLPLEARRTLAEPENVLKTWSAGSWGVVATERRLFIKKGRISRKVAEIPYSKISFIEHTRRYPWKIVLAGLLPALTLLLEPLWRAILKGAFISTLERILASVTTTLDLSAQTLIILLVFVPMLMGSLIFALQARSGFNLHGLETKPIYIPHKFGEVVTFIRNVQDKQQSTANSEKALEKTGHNDIHTPSEFHAEFSR